MVTIPTQGTGLTLTVQDGSATATSSVFDVIAPPTCPCTIWDETGTPTNANESDANALQLGTKFRSGMNGYITGIRFYKGNLNTGTHTGQLYAMDGTLLASSFERVHGTEAVRTFRALKNRLDPDHVLQTDLSRRLMGG